MKKKGLLALMLVLMLCLTIGLTLVACKPTEEKIVDEEKATVSTTMKTVVAAVKKRFNYGDSKKFGFSVTSDNDVFGQKFGFELMGNIDSSTAENNQMQLQIAVGENSLNLIADSQYIYAVSGETKYRYTGVNFGDAVVGKVGKFAQGFSMVDMALTVLAGTVFENYEINDSTYTFSGKVDKLLELLYVFVDDSTIVDAISTALDGSTLTLVAKIKDGIATDVTFNLAIASLGGSIAVSLNDMEFGANYNAPIVVPKADDESYVSTKMINFMLDGTFNLVSRNANYTTTSVVMNWDLVVDINPFDLIRSILGNGGIDGLFKSDSTKFAFNVSHKCANDVACSEFCKSKLGVGLGDFLSIAYDPTSFKDNNIKIALDIAYLLPQGILDSGTTGMLMNFINNKNHIALSVDPSTIIKSLTEGTQVDAVSNMASVGGLGFNPIALASNLFDLLKSISMNEGGLTLSATAIYNLADMFNTPESNIANILHTFLGGADMLNIQVDNYAYASVKMDSHDIRARFLQKSAEDSSSKNFTLASIPDYPDYIPPTFICSENAEVFVDEAGNNNFAFDANYPGTPKTGILTIKELEEIILVGGIRFTATKLTGEKIDAYASIQEIMGLDRNKFGVAQKVRIRVGDLSGTGISQIISIVEGMLNMKIASGEFDATIMLIRAEDIIDTTFVMGDEVVNGSGVITTPKFDENKAYRYDEKFNQKATFTVKFSYMLADGSNYTQSKEVTPSNGSDYMSSSTVKVFGMDYKLNYKFFEQEKLVDVKTYKYNYDTEVKCKPGYSGALSGFDADVKTTVNRNISVSSVRMFYKDAEGLDKYSNAISSKDTSIDELENMVVTKSSSTGIPSGFRFTAVGTYNVTGKICGVPFNATYIVS